MLGGAPDAEDACQDAAIIAMVRIGDLRDPEAARAWLHSIVRNSCKMLLRARRPVPVGLAGQDLVAPEAENPEAVIDRNANRDWVWHAMGQLTPATQLVAMLRYFTDRSSYEEIATACGTPVGTVRSRLSEARRQLAASLPQATGEPHSDTEALTLNRREEAAEILAAPRRLAPLAAAHRRWADDLVWFWPGGERTVGFDRLFEVFRRDYERGVTYKLNDVVAAPGTTIWTAEFVCPPDTPRQCPPSAVWLLREKQGRVAECRFSYAQ
ncbi:RNA polymerase sigma factor [Winogradskya consettensis]|uniref:RNA polymerase sigma factor n=1 Tax=Winogradskya consettensis TaxID=113560 RepID=UPI0034DAD929